MNRRSVTAGGALALGCLASAACGARLTPAQQALYDAQYRSANASQQQQEPVGPGDLSGARPAPGPVTRAATAPVGPAPAEVASQPPTGGAPGRTTAVPHSAPATTGNRASSDDGSVVFNPAVCKGPAGGTGVSATEIDLGNVSTLTGPIPGLFIGAVHGVQAFATYVNSLGGVCGRKLVVKSADDNLQVSQNATATQQLAGSVMAFVGSFSADDQGGASVLRSTGTPDVGEALSGERFDLPNNFAPEPITGWNTAPYVTMKQLYPEAAQHMAILGANQPTAQHEYAVEKAALESVGYHFVYTDPNIEPTQTDYSSDAQAMKAAGAQGVALSSTASLCANLARAIQQAGISPFPLGTYSTTAYDQTFLAQAGSAAEGAILYFAEALYQGEDAQVVPMVATFDRWYQGLYHQVPDEFALYSWISGLLFIDGINRSAGLTQPALLAGLKKVTQFDANGLVATDDPAHKKPPTCYLLIDVKGGKFVRDPSDPPQAFSCKNAPSYYTSGP